LGDNLWLLNEKLRKIFWRKAEEISGAAIEIKITEEKEPQKEIYIQEKNYVLEKVIGN